MGLDRALEVPRDRAWDAARRLDAKVRAVKLKLSRGVSQRTASYNQFLVVPRPQSEDARRL